MTVRALMRSSLAATSLLGVAAMGSTPAQASTRVTVVTISNFMFTPMHVTVMPGALVRVVNRDTVPYTLSALDHRFSTGMIGCGKSRTFRAPKIAGNYRFDCSVHPFMTGTITVR